MQIIRDVDLLRREVAALRADGGRVALAPTMGALHAGHMALIAEAKARATHIVASIFVNPTQFAPTEDLSSYPRREAADAAMLEKAGCDILWAPDAATMYPDGVAATVAVGAIGDGLEGAARPGHFAGVATVVARLFDQIRPDLAVFGEKDFQQLAVIRAMVRDLGLGVEIIGVPTQRDADGLALSSRNIYLSDAERLAARTLPRALGDAARSILAGEGVAAVLAAAIGRLEAAGFDPVDYVALCDAETLEPVGALDRPARLLAAARIGKTRLIDNVPVAAGSENKV